jgi:hypothetical protein
MAIYGAVQYLEREIDRNGNKAFTNLSIPVPIQPHIDNARVLVGVNTPRAELLEEGDEYSTDGKSWKTNWRYDEETDRLLLRNDEEGKSNLPDEEDLSDKSNAQVNAILVARRLFNALPNIPRLGLNRRQIFESRQDQTAIQTAQKQDLALWLGARSFITEHLDGTQQQQRHALDVVTTFVEDYYATIGLRRAPNLEDDGFHKTDLGNWRAAAALAVVWHHKKHTGLTDQEVLSRYGIKEDSRDSVLARAGNIENRDYSGIIDANARLVGRFWIIDYLQNRVAKLNKQKGEAHTTIFPLGVIDRVVSEVVLTCMYGMPAGRRLLHLPIQRTIAKMPDEQLHGNIVLGLS